MQRTVVLGGFMATGKSTVGPALARRLALPFHDLDAMLVARWGAVEHQFKQDGEAAFRARETVALSEAVQGTPCVLATGGGAWASAANQTWLRLCWRIVLTAPMHVLRMRAAEGGGRPLWDGDVAARWAARVPWYAEADAVFDTTGWTPEAIADRIADRVRRWEEA